MSKNTKTKIKFTIKNEIWGLFFVLAAVFVLFGRNLPFFEGISIWRLILGVIMLSTLIEGIKKVNFGEIFFALAVIAIAFDKVLGIEAYTPWPVIGAALLLTIGFELIFGNKKGGHFGVYHNGRKLEKGETIDEEESHDGYYSVETAFATTSKYVSSESLKKADIENSFGSLSVYFDSTTIDGEAVISVENSFGNTALYIPKEWQIRIENNTFLGKVVFNGECLGTADCTAVIKSETSFGSVEINYI